MPGYLVKHEAVPIAGVADLTIRSLLDRQQFSDPFGQALALGISSASWPLFGLVWPSGLHLAAALARRPVQPTERILEVGCGLALASLVGHRRGARMTASDVHPLAASFLRANVLLNALAPLDYCHGDWSVPAAERVPSAHGLPVEGRFELILGSDVLYERDDAGALPRFIGEHAQPGGEVMIIDPNRSNRSAFHRRMAALGYALEEMIIKDPLGPGGPYSGRLLHYRQR